MIYVKLPYSGRRFVNQSDTIKPGSLACIIQLRLTLNAKQTCLPSQAYLRQGKGLCLAVSFDIMQTSVVHRGYVMRQQSTRYQNLGTSLSPFSVSLSYPEHISPLSPSCQKHFMFHCHLNMLDPINMHALHFLPHILSIPPECLAFPPNFIPLNSVSQIPPAYYALILPLCCKHPRVVSAAQSFWEGGLCRR